MNKEIEELSQALISLLDRETVDKFIEDEYGNLKEIKTYSLYSVAEELYNAGYRKEDKKLLVPKDGKCIIERIPMRIDLLDENCSVVPLSREEIRKDTAREILNKVKERSVWFIENPTQKDHFSEQIQELSKEYETGIKQ